MPAQSGRAASIAWNQISAVARVLVKTSAVSPSSTAATTSGNSRRPICPDQGKRSIDTGMSASTSSALGTSPWKIPPCRGRPSPSTPSSASRAVSRLPSVAERPSVRRPGRKRRRRARQSSVCTPRFDAISSCHSSTTTSSRWSNRVAASSRVRRRERLSGVVTSAVGKRSRCRARTRAGVSPVRDSTLQGSPRSSTGARSAASVSPASARSGVSHSTLSGAGWRRPAGG